MKYRARIITLILACAFLHDIAALEIVEGLGERLKNLPESAAYLEESVAKDIPKNPDGFKVYSQLKSFNDTAVANLDHSNEMLQEVMRPLVQLTRQALEADNIPLWKAYQKLSGAYFNWFNARQDLEYLIALQKELKFPEDGTQGIYWWRS